MLRLSDGQDKRQPVEIYTCDKVEETPKLRLCLFVLSLCVLSSKVFLNTQ